MGMAVVVRKFTVDDLEHFPDDGNRYELLDGMLLVTPSPASAHQVLASRIMFLLSAVVQTPGLAYVVGPGVVTLPPRTELQPDVLVFPSRYAPDTPWPEIREFWLAVEILSRSSRVYDREYKRDAYFALGVREVWLVDRRSRSVEVYRAPAVGSVEAERFTWRAPTEAGDVAIEVDVVALFAGLRS